MLYRLKLIIMHTELSKIAQNFEECQVFLYEKDVSLKKSFIVWFGSE